MNGEMIADDRHQRVGQRSYRAVVDVWTDLPPTDDVPVVEIDERDAWFDSLADAGAWVDANAVGPAEGRIEEHVWVETVSIDSDAVRAVYGADRRPTGRYVDRIIVGRADTDQLGPQWSFTENEGGRFDPAVPPDELFWEHDPEPPPTVLDLAAVHRDLTVALRSAWSLCERLHDRYSASPSGTNVPELLRSALEVVTAEVGGTDELVKHRPGSWEADHVRNLAAMSDYAAS